MLRTAILLPVLKHARLERIDVRRRVVIIVGEPQLWHDAPAGELRGDVIEHRTGGHARVLRIERKNDESLHAPGAQRLQPVGNGRLAVTHADLHGHTAVDLPGKRPLQRICQSARVHDERRALRHPDLAIEPGAAPRSHTQDHTVQHRQPKRTGQLDEPRIREHFRQKAPHPTRCRFAWAAEIHEQNADAGALCRRCGRAGIFRHAEVSECLGSNDGRHLSEKPPSSL